MSTLNRLATCKNPYQGERKKVLCLCSAGLLRSPTIAWVLSNDPYNYNTRSAGVTDEYALIPVDDVLLEWADMVVAAEGWHLEAVDTRGKPAIALNVPDIYGFRDPKLVELIQEKLREYGDILN